MKYPNYVNNFTAEIIFFSLSQLRYDINKRSQTQFEDGITFKAPELHNPFQVMPQHGYAPINNHIPFNGIYNQIPKEVQCRIAEEDTTVHCSNQYFSHTGYRMEIDNQITTQSR